MTDVCKAPRINFKPTYMKPLPTDNKKVIGKTRVSAEIGAKISAFFNTLFWESKKGFWKKVEISEYDLTKANKLEHYRTYKKLAPYKNAFRDLTGYEVSTKTDISRVKELKRDKKVFELFKTAQKDKNLQKINSYLSEIERNNNENYPAVLISLRNFAKNQKLSKKITESLEKKIDQLRFNDVDLKNLKYIPESPEFSTYKTWQKVAMGSMLAAVIGYGIYYYAGVNSSPPPSSNSIHPNSEPSGVIEGNNSPLPLSNSIHTNPKPSRVIEDSNSTLPLPRFASSNEAQVTDNSVPSPSVSGKNKPISNEPDIVTVFGPSIDRQKMGIGSRITNIYQKTVPKESKSTALVVLDKKPSALTARPQNQHLKEASWSIMKYLRYLIGLEYESMDKTLSDVRDKDEQVRLQISDGYEYLKNNTEGTLRDIREDERQISTTTGRFSGMLDDLGQGFRKRALKSGEKARNLPLQLPAPSTPIRAEESDRGSEEYLTKEVKARIFRSHLSSVVKWLNPFSDEGSNSNPPSSQLVSSNTDLDVTLPFSGSKNKILVNTTNSTDQCRTTYLGKKSTSLGLTSYFTRLFTPQYVTKETIMRVFKDSLRRAAIGLHLLSDNDKFAEEGNNSNPSSSQLVCSTLLVPTQDLTKEETNRALARGFRESSRIIAGAAAQTLSDKDKVKRPFSDTALVSTGSLPYQKEANQDKIGRRVVSVWREKNMKETPKSNGAIISPPASTGNFFEPVTDMLNSFWGGFKKRALKSGESASNLPSPIPVQNQ